MHAGKLEKLISNTNANAYSCSKQLLLWMLANKVIFSEIYTKIRQVSKQRMSNQNFKNLKTEFLNIKCN
jgi:hypothetical protein